MVIPNFGNGYFLKKQYLCTGFLSSQSSHDKIPKQAGASRHVLTLDYDNRTLIFNRQSIVHRKSSNRKLKL